MALWRLCFCCFALLLLATLARAADETPAYARAMKQVAAKFTGTPGVAIHIGDSITYANPYGQWARGGAGRNAGDLALLKWMHQGANDATDGWWLAAVDRPGGRSETAAGGMRADELLAGGKGGLPSLAELLKKFNPQIVVLMMGTNDCSAGRKVDAYAADMAKALDLILAANAIPILTTIPPHPGKLELSRDYNVALRKLAAERSLPVIDYELEILTRRPNDWNGTLLGKNDVHPTATQGGATASSEPTAENLKNSGYLLRGWLTVKKIGEVKEYVLEAK